MDESNRTTEPHRAIAAARAAFSSAIARGDTKAAASVYSGAASLVAPSADLFEGRAAIEAYWRAGIEAGVATVELEAVQVRHQDRMAYEIGRYHLRMQPGMKEGTVDRGRYVLVLERRDDGSWFRTVEMFSPETPPAVPAAGRRPEKSVMEAS